MSTERSSRPHGNTAVARFLDKRIDELRGVKTQREIATEAGFPRPNILSMLKTGDTKLPLDRVASLARALDADPAHLFRLAMSDHWPELAHEIEEIFGRQMATKHEVEIFLAKWRAATAETDPAPNLQIEAAMDAMFTRLFPIV